MRKVFHFLQMTRELGQYGFLVEIIVGSLLGSFKKSPLSRLMLYSGGRGQWGLKSEAIFSPVFVVTTDKTCFIFAVGFRFGPNQTLSQLRPLIKLESTKIFHPSELPRPDAMG